MNPTIEFVAVAASALYGILRGLRSGFDIVGLLSVAAAAAFGGGTLRDLFLDRTPLFWIEKEYLLWVALGLAAVSAVAPRTVARIEPWLVWPDALGLGFFTVAGVVVAVDAGMTPPVAAVLGVVTGTFGSVICDVICNETPNIFRTSPLCATCALLGGRSSISRATPSAFQRRCRNRWRSRRRRRCDSWRSGETGLCRCVRWPQRDQSDRRRCMAAP